MAADLVGGKTNQWTKIMKTKILMIAILAGLLALSACGETNAQLAAAQSYSCTQLAREIGKREQVRDSAQIDSVVDTVASAVIDDKEERRATDIRLGVNAFEDLDAQKSLKQLTQIYRSKGCT